MAIPAMALLQQHDARRDILIEPAARRRAAIEARGIPNWGRSELGAQSGRKNQPACLCVCLSLAALPQYCTDPDVSWRNGRRCPLVVHY